MKIIVFMIAYVMYLYTYMYIYTSVHKWSPTHRVLKSHRSKMSVIYQLSWKQCPPVYHHSGFVATRALGHMMHDIVFMYIHMYAQTCASSFLGLISVARVNVWRTTDVIIVGIKEILIEHVIILFSFQCT